jgi:hypothetical protein
VLLGESLGPSALRRALARAGETEPQIVPEINEPADLESRA